MEELKSENDGIITLRFAEKLVVRINPECYLKQNFISGNDHSREFTLEEINSINTMIRLGNKITKGYEDEKNNSGNQYNSNAKMTFEPGKDYEITKSQFEQLRKVFFFQRNFLETNKKIEFKFFYTLQIKRRYIYLWNNSGVKKLLQDNSIEIGISKNKKTIITLEAGEKYYFTVKDIKLLNGVFEIDKAYTCLTPDCIHKNIFDMPLDILQPFICKYCKYDLGPYEYYHQYILKEKAKKIQELKKKNGIEYDGIECGCWSRLVDIKQSYKNTRENIEKEAKNIDTSKSADEMNKIINNCLNEIKSKDKLVEIVTVLSKLNEYFANKAVNTINKKIKYYGFQEIQCENKLAEVFELALDKGSLRAEDMRIILIKIKESLNEAILKEALNVLIQNISNGNLVDKKLLNAVETFLSGNSDFGPDNLETILKSYIKPENVQEVLCGLKKLKDEKLKTYEAIDRMIEGKIVKFDLKENKEIHAAIKEIVDHKSFSLSHEYVIKILEQVKIPDVSLNFVDTIFKKTTTDDDEDEKSIKTRISDMNCIIDTVRKYKLDIEDQNPLRNIMRLFFNAENLGKIDIYVIVNKISELLQEQIYTEALKKRPALLLFFDVNFLYKKIIMDPNDNIFKKTFLNINKDNKEILLDSENNHIAFYWNSFLGNVEKNLNNDGVTDLENYFYDFLLFVIENINKFDNENSAIILILMLMSKFSPEFFYKKIFPDTKDKAEDIEQKNPIKHLVKLLFKDVRSKYWPALKLRNISRNDRDVVIKGCKNKIEFRDDYYARYIPYFVLIAHILSNLEYKPEYKDNFLYFLDPFNENMENMEVCDYCAWVQLFDFVDPSFLYGNLDVIERYLTFCKKSKLTLSRETKSNIENICDYDNYLKYATGPKLNETDYFYTLLSYNEQCINYFKPKWVVDHLKDEDMKNYYQLIRDNTQSKVNGMYQYIKTKQYDKPEQQKQDILLLIEIFPDAMSQYIDAEFLIDNWNALVQDFQEKCTYGGALVNFFDGLKNISDIKKMEEWYVDLLTICPLGYYYTYREVIGRFVDNYDKFSNEGLKACIDLYKQKGDEIYSCLLRNLFNEVKRLDLERGKYIVSKPKAEKTLWLIKTFGAKKASEHVDKEFLIRNLNDQDIGNTVKDCIKLCAEADDEFCKSLCEVAMDEQFYKNFEDKDKRSKKEKMIWDLINIGREKIFEHVDNQFLLENLDNEIIKGLINYASETKINYMFESINNLDCDNNAKIDMYYKLINYRPDLLGVLRSSYFNSNTNFIQALNKSTLEKNISVLSFLNNYHSEEQNHNVHCFILNLINMDPCDTQTQLINAIACLDSFELQRISYFVYECRNCAYLKFHIDNNNFSFYDPIDNPESSRLAENLFKIHNQQDCNLHLTDLVSGNCRLCCETIDSYLQEYHELSTIIKSSWKKYLWFVGVACFILLAIFISGFWVELLAINFVRYIPIILCDLLVIDLLSAIDNKDSFIFKKIFLSRNLTEYETKIKHQKEARHGFYSFLNDKFDFGNHIGIYDEVINNIKGKNVDIKKDFFDWLKANNKDEPFDKENDRNKKIDFVVYFILRAPNNEIIKKLDSEIKTLEDFSNDNKAISLLDNWLNKNQNYNDCRDVLQSEFLDMIKFKSGELKIKLKRKDNIKTLAEKIYNQIIDPQDQKLDLSEKNNILIEEEIDTSEKNINDNNNQSGNNNLMPQSENQKENQIEN